MSAHRVGLDAVSLGPEPGVMATRYELVTTTRAPIKHERRPTSSATRRRRSLPTWQPGVRTLAAVIVGLLLLVGVSRAIAPSPSEPSSGSLLQTLWADPIPSFLGSSIVGD